MPPPRGEVFVRALLAKAARHGITNPRQLATRSGVAYDTIRGWKKGTTPTAATLERLQPYTGLSVSEMLDLWQGIEHQPPDDLAVLIKAQTKALLEQAEGFNRLAAAMDRMTKRWDARLSDLVAAVLAPPATSGTGPDAPPSPRPSGGTRAG